MGKALADGRRAKIFLMTKIDGRTKAEAARQIDESLSRLQTDHVDLIQFHEVIRLEDPDRIFAEGGGMEAMVEAKKAQASCASSASPATRIRSSTSACSTSHATINSISMPCRCP